MVQSERRSVDVLHGQDGRQSNRRSRESIHSVSREWRQGESHEAFASASIRRKGTLLHPPHIFMYNFHLPIPIFLT